MFGVIMYKAGKRGFSIFYVCVFIDVSRKTQDYCNEDSRGKRFVQNGLTALQCDKVCC